jgi:hypothetical protein
MRPAEKSQSLDDEHIRIVLKYGLEHIKEFL